MKKYVQASLLLLLLTTWACQKNQLTTVSPAVGDTSANSLDWEGEYVGVVPCADCEGIATAIRLSQDETYSLTMEYLGKDGNPVKKEGAFAWNDTGNIITLSNVDGGASKYLVGENKLFQLDLDGNRITGELADNYVLEKQRADTHLQDNPLAGKKWLLIELRGKEINSEETPIFFQMDATEQRITGFGGCNNFFGEYVLKEGLRISFEKLGRTQKYCQESIAMENEFFEAMEIVDNYSIGGENILSLNRARMAPLLRFILAED